jgi:predicted transcriptional regulator
MGLSTTRPNARWKEVRRNPVRDAILLEVGRVPGIHFRELSRRLALADGDLAYHLHVLTQANLLRCESLTGRKLYFAGEGTPERRDEIPLGTEREVLDCIQAREPTSIHTVASLVGVSYADASYHVRNLRALGLVDAERGSEGLVLRVTECAAEA